MKYIITIAFVSLACFSLHAQASKEDSTAQIEGKKGWTFAGLPVISYDADVGLQYGALVNFYNYGDGTTYPEYLQSIYMEWSRTTKGSGVNRLYFDSEHVIPGIRLSVDLSYLTEQTLQFFGFNGYDAVYNASWEDDTSPDYVSRVFYRHDRKMFRFITSFQGNLLKSTERFRWVAGFTYTDNSIASVDIDRLNKGKDANDQLPDVDGLYDKYVSWGAIKEDEATGNKITYLKAGLVYDTRNEEAFPAKGIWADAIFSYAPAFLGDGKFEYSKLTMAFRQYVSLGSPKLVLAYRVGYQTTVTGTVPFHMQPHLVPVVMIGASSEGLGGSRSLRGVMRNRVVGDAVALGNVELRWRFLKMVLMKQKLTVGTNLFADFGQVVKKIEVDVDQQQMGSDNYDDYFAPGTESLHVSAGAGLKFALNDNFVVSFDYGMATDYRDGDSGLYINMNWLF